MSGSGWTCAGTSCTRSDALAGGDSYPSVTAVANVGPGARAQVTAQFSVSGGGAFVAGGSDLAAVTRTAYIVGDAYPYTANAMADFGDSATDILDLIMALRAVTAMPGFVPPCGSDRFDAMDSYPVDTANTRGGDQRLSIVDLIITLRRVTGIDVSRPFRSPQSVVCPAGNAQAAAISRGGGGLAAGLRVDDNGEERGRGRPRPGAPAPAPAPEDTGWLELGPAQVLPDGSGRVPVFLGTRQAVQLAGAAWSLAAAGEPRLLQFVAAEAGAPDLLDNGIPGTLAVAWLRGLSIGAGEHTLLGYVDVPDVPNPQLKVLHVSADEVDGKAVSIAIAPRGMSVR